MRLADYLPENTIHVWKVQLDDATWDRHDGILSADEHARADRLQDVQRQAGFRRCRTALRVLLGRYAGQRGGDLKFGYGRFGKPELVMEADGSPNACGLNEALHFNLTHCGAVAAIAVSRNQVGIDLEVVIERDVDVLGKLVCDPGESAALSGLRGMEKLLLFYRLWTRKEAYWKAVGTGVRSDLREVSFASRSAAASRVLGPPGKSATAYFVHDLSFPGGVLGSVSTTLAAPKIEIFALRSPAALEE